MSDSANADSPGQLPAPSYVFDPQHLAAAMERQHVSQTLASHAIHGGNQVREVVDVIGLLARSAHDSLTKLGEQHTQARQEVQAQLSRLRPSDFGSYTVDVWQRWVLFLDILRKRGNNFVRHEAEGCPPVLAYDYDVVIDGRDLDRPVNYSLVAIRPPQDVAVRQDGRPYIIIDPRAGHGSGIGGFKNESEVGVALRAGHPVYFCVFTTQPTSTQTLADITRAEAHFVRAVQRRHPRSPKPVVIGNCQGGWAAMLLAATNPDLTGPIVVNGSPLSYWAGVRGKNRMRYMGGLAGGVLPAMLMSDLGNGRFDGANLVLNFESLNPGNNWWKKYYDVFANTESEGERYLEFERWWSGFYFMNESEIRWIVENLFVGNRLARGGAQLDSRMHVDLRNVRAPIIVFASHGDNITPPAQALNWIADIYSSAKEIKARGQRIVYTIHDNVGHLGIFVSSAVAKREHKEIVSTLKTIEAMAPGLYEMKIDEVIGEGHEQRYAIAFEERDVADILALDDDRSDEKHFAAVSRLSELGAELYNLTLRPWVRASVNEGSAQWLFNQHPLRTRRYALSDRNPLLAPIASMADVVRSNRVVDAPNNPIFAWEKTSASLFTEWLNLARDLRDGVSEVLFYGLYASPQMQAVAANSQKRISEVSGTDLRSIGEVHQALELIDQGGVAEAVIRMLILLAHARKSVRRDRLERSNELLTQQEPFASLGATVRNRIIFQQGLIVEFEPEQALLTLPLLLADPKDRRRALVDCKYIVGASEEMSPETRAMMDRLHEVLEVRGVSARKGRGKS